MAAVRRSAAVVALCLLAPSQARAEDPPCWVRSGSCPQWPPDRYLLGVGIGDVARQGLADATEAAASRAFAALARQIRVDVDASLWVSAFETAGGGGEAVSEEVRTTARLLLEGAETRERWQDPDGRSVHALAVLDRQAFGRRNVAGASAADAQLRRALAASGEAEGRGDVMEAVGLLTEAHAHALEVERRLDLVRIVAREPGPAPAAASAELAFRLDGLKDRLGVAVRIDEKGYGRGGPVVRDAVLEALGARGVRVLEERQGKRGRRGKAGGVALVVEGQASAEHSSSVSSKLHFALARGVLRVVRPRDGKVLATVEKEVKGAGRDEAHAKDQALRKLAAEVAAEVAGATAVALGGGG